MTTRLATMLLVLQPLARAATTTPCDCPYQLDGICHASTTADGLTGPCACDPYDCGDPCGAALTCEQCRDVPGRDCVAPGAGLSSCRVFGGDRASIPDAIYDGARAVDRSAADVCATRAGEDWNGAFGAACHTAIAEHCEYHFADDEDACVRAFDHLYTSCAGYQIGDLPEFDALEAGAREGRGGRGVIYVWATGNGAGRPRVDVAARRPRERRLVDDEPRGREPQLQVRLRAGRRARPAPGARAVDELAEERKLEATNVAAETIFDYDGTERWVESEIAFSEKNVAVERRGTTGARATRVGLRPRWHALLGSDDDGDDDGELVSWRIEVFGRDVDPDASPSAGARRPAPTRRDGRPTVAPDCGAPCAEARFQEDYRGAISETATGLRRCKKRKSSCRWRREACRSRNECASLKRKSCKANGTSCKWKRKAKKCKAR
ncbi:serine-type endopeptidase [Aureococcus anophagefferens]|uniref:Serine-type endopeptidase n=1 Tax=Aureococcus anophagefferens TaxID=44056 RepID=A0ABR1FVJ6_AURAN